MPFGFEKCQNVISAYFTSTSDTAFGFARCQNKIHVFAYFNNKQIRPFSLKLKLKKKVYFTSKKILHFGFAKCQNEIPA